MAAELDGRLARLHDDGGDDRVRFERLMRNSRARFATTALTIGDERLSAHEQLRTGVGVCGRLRRMVDTELYGSVCEGVPRRLSCRVGGLHATCLVVTEKVGRVGTCRIGARRLEEAAAWIESYHQLWDARLGELD